MIDPESQALLRREILARMMADRGLLDVLREEIRPLGGRTRAIQPRSTTALSLVGADGGSNTLHFDPFLVQIVRVVDSSNEEYCLEVITPTTSVAALSARQFKADGSPRTPLGRMMRYLGVHRLDQLSPHIRSNESGRYVNPAWVKAYRELVEWSVLFSFVWTKEYGNDTLIVYDGLLRSTVFTRGLFEHFLAGLDEGIETHYQRTRRRIYLTGVAKHSQVLERYRLAMALEEVLTTEYPAYVEVPPEIESHVYQEGYARGEESSVSRANARGAAGKMFFAKFGRGRRDPIWPIDIFHRQTGDAAAIFGYMLSDAIEGFPVPYYPRCLQRAHENAALVDFDFDILQDDVFDGIREALGDEAAVLDAFRLQDADPARARYA